MKKIDTILARLAQAQKRARQERSILTAQDVDRLSKKYGFKQIPLETPTSRILRIGRRPD